ncbi:hypothetical protein Tco_0823413 [Tanacetum coccineum]|uniref:Uncharacterized protein n=1 Tax=Tanacetum coccineum TaxID=301880 RepID=A0ABQ5AMT6_9ASTR
MASLQLENAHLKQTYKDLFESVQRSKVETHQCDEAKVKDDFDEIETRNIELEYRVASLIKENEHLKLTYKTLFDSIKKSQVQTKTSNVTQDEAENLKSQLFEFAETKFKNIFGKIEFFKKKQLDISELNKGSGETVCDNAKLKVEELKSVNASLNSSVEELYNDLAKATLRERDEMISAQCEKMRLLEEKSKSFYEVPSEFDSKIVHDTQDNSEKDLILNIDQMKSQVSELGERLQISNQEMKQQIVIFEEDKQMFLAKNEFLEKLSSSVQKEYNDLLASNDVLKQRLETKFKFLKHDNSLEKMFEMIELEYESNVSKISITSSSFESKNLELVKEIGDKVKRFDDKKKVFETKISKLEKVLAQRVKDFDDVKIELSKRTDKFETYFANLEKENALLKSQLASQNYTSLQKENNVLRTSYYVLKEKYETSCEKLEKENNDFKMHYKRLFDSIKQKKVVSQVFTKSIPKVNVSKKIYTDNQSLLLQYSRDGYVIEGELREYEDSCEKSSVQVFYKEMLNQYHRVSRSFVSNIMRLKSTFKIKFKVKDFIQAIKESSCKRRSKLAFENADFEFESRVDTFRDKEIYLVI